jgi:hypothetical protein
MLDVGFLAIFSIGTLLILAGGLFALAASRAATFSGVRDGVMACAVGTAACIVVPAALRRLPSHASDFTQVTVRLAEGTMVTLG